MDHSIRSYLSRRTTQQLDYILDYYLHQEVCEYHAEIIRTILSILQERDGKEPFGVTPELLEIYDRLYGPVNE